MHEKGVLIAVLETLELRRSNPAYGDAVRFRARIFAITFATGVVTVSRCSSCSARTGPDSPISRDRKANGVYLFGMTLVMIYLVNIYRVWRGKVRKIYH